MITVVVDFDRKRAAVALHVFLASERDEAEGLQRDLIRDYYARRELGHELCILEGSSLKEIRQRHKGLFPCRT